MHRTTILVLSVLVALSACSSIHTQPTPKKDHDGLVYYLPKKDFLVTVVVGDTGTVSGVSLGTTAAYPDLSKSFALSYGANAAGKNVLDVNITEAGLLDSSKSTTQSGVSEILTELAGAIGAVKGPFDAQVLRDADKDKVRAIKCGPGSHTFLVAATVRKTDSLCGLTVTVEPQFKPEHVDTKAIACKKAENGFSGIVYRQNLPYRIEVGGASLNAQGVLFSPSEAPTRCLPISKTFFSNNAAEFGFKDGVPTMYKQETEGEAIALLKLPADVIGAYFVAVGSMFDSFKKTDEKESAALAESLKLELAKMKYDACIAAFKVNDRVRIEELGCD